MMDRRAFLACAGAALLGPSLARAQDEPYGLIFDQGRYLPYWQSLQGAPGPIPLPQFAAMLGDEPTALARAYKQQNPSLSLPPEPLKATAAIPRIVAAAKGRRLVILNEAHVCSRHRAFLADLLVALRPEGFTHLAAETFGNDPDSPNVSTLKAGQPFDPGMGTYSLDPVLAETVRQSVELGYRLASYEIRNDQRDPARTAKLESIAQREAAEAANLAALLAADPEARFVVYVGYNHLREGLDAEGSSWMARRLKDATGIDPLTVSQSSTGSFGPHAPDGPLTQAVLARFNPQRPIVVETDAGVCIGAGMDTADLAVFHPSLPDQSGRPGWLAAAPGRKPVTAALPPFEGPALVQAIHAGDPDICVPADQYLLKPGDRSANLLLRPGRYRVRVETLSGFLPLGEIDV